MPKAVIDFNINDIVSVKLTEHGKEILRKERRELLKVYPTLDQTRDGVPKEDENGYSRWQLWNLIQSFGLHVGMGRQLPFETNIKLEVSDA